MQQSYVEHSASGCTAVVGPDAVNYMRAATLRSSLRLWLATKMIPTRGVTITVMLRIATEYTGKKYTTKQAPQAIADLDTWIATMRAALPVVER
jgi:hypothetical protein